MEVGMDTLIRIIFVAIRYGFFGIVFGAVCGILVGTMMGLIFGHLQEFFTFCGWYGVVVGGISFAWTGVIWDDGPGRGFFGGSTIMDKPAVLFLCTNNAVRSQMAEALLKKKGADKFDAYSAGTEPKEIHPLTIKVMSEVGIDLSAQHPKALREFLGRLAVQYAVFVCPKAEEKCPTLWPGALNRLEWPFDDPSAFVGTEEERIAKFRSVRDQIDLKITTWLAQLSVA